tara:strand:- start:46 stop:513 length:468 start_codon:yes stop_codon:yes gene_type:complete
LFTQEGHADDGNNRKRVGRGAGTPGGVGDLPAEGEANVEQDGLTQTATFAVDGETMATDDGTVTRAIEELRGAPGVRTAELDGTRLVVEFQPYLMSEEGLRERIRGAGVQPAAETRPPRRRNIFQRFVDRLASENQRNLGSGRLDCCDLNKANRA